MAENEPTLGEQVTRLHEIKQQKKAHAAKIRELEDQIEELEDQLLTRLDAEGVDATKAGGISVTIKEDSLPSIALDGDELGWDAVFKHIQATGDFFLLQRRFSKSACEELHATGNLPAAIKMTKKRSINTRKV